MALIIEFNPREYGLSNSTTSISIPLDVQDREIDLSHSIEIRISLDNKTAEWATNLQMKSFHPLEDPSIPIIRRKIDFIEAE